MTERDVKSLMTAILLSRNVRRRELSNLAIEDLPLDVEVIDDAVTIADEIYKRVGRTIR